MRRTLRVRGMSCGGCARGVERALSALSGVEWVEVDLDAGTARMEVSEGFQIDAAVEAVRRAGCDVEP